MAGHFQLRNRHWPAGASDRSSRSFLLSPSRSFPLLLLILLSASFSPILSITDFSAPKLLAATDEPPAEPATARLVADVTSIEPGKTFRLGVHFRMEPLWHIYWHSARDGGLGTKIDWRLPEGLSAGELSWPVPKRYQLEGDLVAFGYGHEVLIFTEVTVDPNFSAEGPIEIGAQLSWLVCKKVCLIGAGNPTLSLPVGSAKPANGELFERFAARLPHDSERAKAQGVLVSEQLISSAGGTAPKEWQISVEFPQNLPPKKAFQLYPFDVPGATLGLGSVETDGSTALIKFSIDVYDPEEFQPARVGAVVSWGGPSKAKAGSGAPKGSASKTSALRVTVDAKR